MSAYPDIIPSSNLNTQHSRHIFNNLVSYLSGPHLKPALFTIILFCVLWNFPTPTGLSTQAWDLFSIFVTAIFAIIVKPLPMGAITIIAISLATITKTITIDEALSSYSSKIVWLILIAFLLARGFIKTGLGARIAYCFVYFLGKSTLGLGYGLMCTELLLAPFIPSNAARGAGIIFPIATALNKEYASLPEDGTENKIGSFLIKTCFHTNVITSAMFVTAMAANPMIVSFAEQFGVTITWLSWVKAAIVPGLLSLFLLPLITYNFCKPQIKHTPEARVFAQAQLDKMGKLSNPELIMILAFATLIILWIFGSHIGVDSTVAAFFGLSILLISGVLTWNDILNEKNGWDTFIWLTALLMMTNQLAKLGFMTWFSSSIHGSIAHFHWLPALLLLSAIYFYSHYFFASLSSHVSSMFVPFTLVAVATGAPATLAVFLFAYLSNICASVTHYSTGAAPVYFGAKYVSIKSWWLLGGIIGTINLAIWLIVGGAWWKFIGLW